MKLKNNLREETTYEKAKKAIDPEDETEEQPAIIKLVEEDDIDSGYDSSEELECFKEGLEIPEDEDIFANKARFNEAKKQQQQPKAKIVKEQTAAKRKYTPEDLSSPVADHNIFEQDESSKAKEGQNEVVADDEELIDNIQGNNKGNRNDNDCRDLNAHFEFKIKF